MSNVISFAEAQLEGIEREFGRREQQLLAFIVSAGFTVEPGEGGTCGLSWGAHELVRVTDGLFVEYVYDLTCELLERPTSTWLRHAAAFVETIRELHAEYER